MTMGPPATEETRVNARPQPHEARFDAAFSSCPMIAILRGLVPGEAEAIGDVLVEAGFGMIEVPLNSPDPFDSIARLVRRHGERALIGAGTVTATDEVRELARIGAALAISPHADPEVIRLSREHGLVSVPGVMSATEAFSALRAGAHALKLFPMEIIGGAGVKALRAVLPKGLRLIAVGGVDATTIAPFRAAGCAGFGAGGSLFKPGQGTAEVAANAARLLAALDRCRDGA